MYFGPKFGQDKGQAFKNIYRLSVCPSVCTAPSVDVIVQTKLVHRWTCEFKLSSEGAGSNIVTRSGGRIIVYNRLFRIQILRNKFVQKATKGMNFDIMYLYLVINTVIENPGN